MECVQGCRAEIFHQRRRLKKVSPYRKWMRGRKKEQEAGEEEDVNEEADNHYWEAKANEGVHMVCLEVDKN